MADCPRGLVGTEWLVAQGARHELPRARVGKVNSELSSSLMYLAQRTEMEVAEDDAEVWQVAYADEAFKASSRSHGPRSYGSICCWPALCGTGVKHM